MHCDNSSVPHHTASHLPNNPQLTPTRLCACRGTACAPEFTPMPLAGNCHTYHTCSPATRRQLSCIPCKPYMRPRRTRDAGVRRRRHPRAVDIPACANTSAETLAAPSPTNACFDHPRARGGPAAIAPCHDPHSVTLLRVTLLSSRGTVVECPFPQAVLFECIPWPSLHAVDSGQGCGLSCQCWAACFALPLPPLMLLLSACPTTYIYYYTYTTRV